MLSIFGRNVTITTSDKMAAVYRRVLCQNTSKIGAIFTKIVASKVGVSPLKGQISKKKNLAC